MTEQKLYVQSNVFQYFRHYFQWLVVEQEAKGKKTTRKIQRRILNPAMKQHQRKKWLHCENVAWYCLRYTKKFRSKRRLQKNRSQLVATQNKNLVLVLDVNRLHMIIHRNHQRRLVDLQNMVLVVVADRLHPILYRIRLQMTVVAHHVHARVIVLTTTDTHQIVRLINVAITSIKNKVVLENEAVLIVVVQIHAIHAHNIHVRPVIIRLRNHRVLRLNIVRKRRSWFHHQSQS